MSHKLLPPIPVHSEYHLASTSSRASYHDAPPSYRASVPLDVSQRLEKKLAEYNASQRVFKRWMFEIISWTISAVCMVGTSTFSMRVVTNVTLLGSHYRDSYLFSRSTAKPATTRVRCEQRLVKSRFGGSHPPYIRSNWSVEVVLVPRHQFEGND